MQKSSFNVLLWTLQMRVSMCLYWLLDHKTHRTKFRRLQSCHHVLSFISLRNSACKMYWRAYNGCSSMLVKYDVHLRLSSAWGYMFYIQSFFESAFFRLMAVVPRGSQWSGRYRCPHWDGKLLRLLFHRVHSPETTRPSPPSHWERGHPWSSRQKRIVLLNQFVRNLNHFVCRTV